MALEQHTREIGSHTYTVTTLDAVKGRKAFVRLLNVMGPILKSASDVETLVANLASGLSPADMDHFCELFGGVTTVTGGEYGDKTPLLLPAAFGTHFAGNYLEMFEWLGFCFEANFGSFFKGVGNLIAKIPAIEGKTAKA